MILGPFRVRAELLGMASGTRELPVLTGDHVTNRTDALLLTGGSAFGLAAADGVMRWLEARGAGFPTGVTSVPIVPTAVLFDLASGRARPGPAEGERACDAAGAGPVKRGRVGAGVGARVGKVLGPDHSVPGGVGSSSGNFGEWNVAALAVVNALGEVVDREGRVVAGPEGTRALLAEGHAGRTRVDEFQGLREGENTTLCAVATDAPLSFRDLGRALRVAATALPRRISPAFTPFDGDVVFGIVPDRAHEPLSSGGVLALGVALREQLEDAILDAVTERGGGT